MLRVLRLGCLVLIALGMCAPQAEANLLDWMQELSGPGPFDGRDNVMFTKCFTEETKSPTYTKTISISKTPCVFVDLRRLRTDREQKNPGFGNVDVFAADFGPSWQILRPVEVGFGAGVMHFDSKNIDGNNKRKTRITLVLARVQVKPILFVRPGFWEGHRRARQWASVVKWYTHYNVILGTLRAEDFGVGPETSTWSVTNDLVRSRGFLLDFGELFYNR